MKESKAEFQKALDCMLFEGVDSCWAELFLQQNGQSRCFPKGEEIYSPAHYSKSLGIIVRGRTVVEKECGVLLNDLGAGQCFGAAALFVPQDQYVTTVRAKTGCSILFLSMEQMRQILLQNPTIAFNYIRFLSGQNPVFKPQNRQLHRPRRAAGAALLSCASSPAARAWGSRWSSSPRCSTSGALPCTARWSSWSRAEKSSGRAGPSSSCRNPDPPREER